MSFKRRGYIKAAISTLICTPILFMNYDVVNAKSIERDYVRECEIIERTQPNENIDIDTFNVSRNIIENNIISYACNFLGTPYVYGANGPNSFDCSGFTKYIFESISINLPRTSQAQYYNGILVNKEDLKNGDLVFFNTDTTLGHVGIYIGNDEFIHASSSKGVTISSLNNGYYASKYAGAVRY